MYIMAAAVYEFNVGCIDGKDHFDIGKLLLLIAKKFTFQKEMGHKTQRLHWQGRLSLRKKTTKQSLINLFKDTDYPSIDIRPTVPENTKGEPFYCLKLDTKVEGPWTETYFKDNEPVWYPPQLLIIKMQEYQDLIYNAFGYNFRNLNLLIDTKGNIGKTTIALRMFAEGLAVIIPPINNYKDFSQFAYSMFANLDRKKRYTVFVDMPKCASKENLIGIFSSLETLKGGYIFDTRNKGRAMLITSPDIWIMTNERPDKSMLSIDRWCEYKVVDGQLINYDETLIKHLIKKIK